MLALCGYAIANFSPPSARRLAVSFAIGALSFLAMTPTSALAQGTNACAIGTVAPPASGNILIGSTTLPNSNPNTQLNYVNSLVDPDVVIIPCPFGPQNQTTGALGASGKHRQPHSRQSWDHLAGVLHKPAERRRRVEYTMHRQ